MDGGWPGRTLLLLSLLIEGVYSEGDVYSFDGRCLVRLFGLPFFLYFWEGRYSV